MKPPVIYLFDTQMRLVGQIRRYISLKFCRAWKSVGDKFEVNIADYNDILPLLKKGYYICLDGDPRRCGCIRGVRFVETGVRKVVVTGFSCKWLARTRINKQPDSEELAVLNFGYDAVPLARYEGDPQTPLPAETVLKTYAERHMVRPEDEKRKIPGLEIANDEKRGKTMRWLAENGAQLDTTLESVCEYANIGYDIRLDIDNQRLVFDVITGVDRSRNQLLRQPVVFSVEHRNLSTAEYYSDDEAYRNVVYAKSGEQSGGVHAQPAYTSETAMPVGLDRREMFSDCSSLSLAETKISVSAKTKALQELSEHKGTDEITCTVVSTGPYEYLKDWDVGDLVSVDMVSFGKTVDKRIATVTEEYSAGKYTVTPGFKTEETARVKLIRRLKKIIVGGK